MDASETVASIDFVTGSRALAIESSFTQRAAKGSAALTMASSPEAISVSSALRISGVIPGAMSGFSDFDRVMRTVFFRRLADAGLPARRTTAWAARAASCRLPTMDASSSTSEASFRSTAASRDSSGEDARAPITADFDQGS